MSPHDWPPKKVPEESPKVSVSQLGALRTETKDRYTVCTFSDGIEIYGPNGELLETQRFNPKCWEEIKNLGIIGIDKKHEHTEEFQKIMYKLKWLVNKTKPKDNFETVEEYMKRALLASQEEENEQEQIAA